MKKFFRKLPYIFDKEWKARAPALWQSVRMGYYAMVRDAEEARERAERDARPYPEYLLIRIDMTEEDYYNLSLWSDLPEGYIKTCDFGFRYRKKGGIVAEVCPGLEMDVRQWGSGMSVPERGERYYRAVIPGPSFIPAGIS